MSGLTQTTRIGDSKLSRLLGMNLRSNPEFELVELLRFSDAERQTFDKLKEDGSCFGVLRPTQGSSLTMKSVCKETALVFYAMTKVGPLPHFLCEELARDGSNGTQLVAELVLDGVLELQTDQGFVSGAAAFPFLYDNQQPLDNQSHLAKISLAAIQLGQRLFSDEPMRVSAFMYFYNRNPVTPRLQRALHTDTAYEQFLGLERGGACAQVLQDNWEFTPLGPTQTGWRSWTAKKKKRLSRGTKAGFKLYFSPTCESLPACLPTFIRTLTELAVPYFKIGADLPGLCRPDKIVAYFNSFDHVQEVGRAVAEAVGDVTVQGVPFSADLFGNGLLSWGIDPKEMPALEGQEVASWRLWITNHIARSVLQCKGDQHATMEPWQYSLDRLRLEGIDTETWTPTDTFEQRRRERNVT
ncbi:MAG: hypothetical protein ABL888_17405 [Pirellulaceae bacterium]